MDPIFVGVIGFIVMLALILCRVHIAFAMGIVGVVGAWYFMGSSALVFLTVVPWDQTATFEHAVLPLFILMGMFAAHSGIAILIFDAAQKWMGKFRGGLLMATTISIGFFGACCGSSVATAQTFTTIAFPQLRKHNYDPGLSGGAIAAGGTQSALIPPSALLVFYGILTEQSIGKLLIAALIPGILSVAIYMGTVYITLLIYPKKGPGTQSYTMKERIWSLKGIWPVPLIFIVMLGGMYFGFFTPSEAAAVGALTTMIVAIITAGFKNAQIPRSLANAARATGMIFLILVAAMIFVRFAALAQIPNELGGFLKNIDASPVMILLVILLIYLVLGCVLDALGLIALTIPIVYPIVEMLNLDPIWFGILLVKVVEIGLITPPIGINVFVVKAAAGIGVSTGQLFRGIVPFLIADVITLALLIYFPAISLWLPSHMQ